MFPEAFAQQLAKDLWVVYTDYTNHHYVLGIGKTEGAAWASVFEDLNKHQKFLSKEPLKAQNFIKERVPDAIAEKICKFNQYLWEVSYRQRGYRTVIGYGVTEENAWLNASKNLNRCLEYNKPPT